MELNSLEYNLKEQVNQQRLFFKSGKTQSIDFRLQHLKKLYSVIDQYYHQIVDALYQDLKKPETEVVLGELHLLKHELKLTISSLKQWAKPSRVASSFPACWPGKSILLPEPYGVVLIIAPWNYPVLLTLLPLVGAIAAGNCVVIKPSELAPCTQHLLVRLIADVFDQSYVRIVSGGVEATKTLLTVPFDYLFFTGGAQIAKQVMRAAADCLTPLTLELGGKSPCLIDETAQIDFAARRIIWAKFMNAGQTCIAPDFVLIHRSQKTYFIQRSQTYLKKFYGDDPKFSKDYARIVSEKHFNRLTNLLRECDRKLLHNADQAELYFPPMILEGVMMSDEVMREEIFGPILPIIEYDTLDEAVDLLKSLSKPLAFYLFSNNTQIVEQILKQVSFGGACVNDCAVHIANLNLPFGGVGQSGMGAYHGRYTFDTFTHYKSIFKRSYLWDVFLQYPPYSLNKLRWLKRLLRF